MKHDKSLCVCIPPLDALLAGRSQAELIALIGEMIKREPELLALVELPVATEQVRQGKPFAVTAYRHRAGTEPAPEEK
jgi:hypothetical protein